MRRQRKHIKDCNKKYNKKGKTTETSIQNTEVTSHILSVDSKQGGVHGQKQVTALVCRRHERIKEYNKQYNKKYKLTETSIQNSETIRTLIVATHILTLFKARRRIQGRAA